MLIDLDLLIQNKNTGGVHNYTQAEIQRLSKIQHSIIEFVESLCQEFGVDPNQAQYFFSGFKGYHIMLPSRWFGLHPQPKLEKFIELLIRDITQGLSIGQFIDWGVYQRNRWVRIPNTINKAAGLFKIPIQYSELLSLTQRQIIRMAQTQRSNFWSIDLNEVDKNQGLNKKCVSLQSSSNFIQINSVHSRLSEGVALGERCDTALVIATSLRDLLISIDEAENKLVHWNKSNRPPLDVRSELIPIIKNAFSRSPRTQYITPDGLILQHIRNFEWWARFNHEDRWIILQIISRTNTTDKVWQEEVTVPKGSLVLSNKTLADNSTSTEGKCRHLLNKLKRLGIIDYEQSEFGKLVTWNEEMRGIILCN
ncbi:MAG: hypothetical protein H8D23_14995 [Candidatus Brocadiales bacterium]|nr:hypothetical protein [Candidatus Brocadiales bacterium]